MRMRSRPRSRGFLDKLDGRGSQQNMRGGALHSGPIWQRPHAPQQRQQQPANGFVEMHTAHTHTHTNKQPRWPTENVRVVAHTRHMPEIIITIIITVPSLCVCLCQPRGFRVFARGRTLFSAGPARVSDARGFRVPDARSDGLYSAGPCSRIRRRINTKFGHLFFFFQLSRSQRDRWRWGWGVGMGCATTTRRSNTIRTLSSGIIAAKPRPHETNLIKCGHDVGDVGVVVSALIPTTLCIFIHRKVSSSGPAGWRGGGVRLAKYLQHTRAGKRVSRALNITKSAERQVIWKLDRLAFALPSAALQTVRPSVRPAARPTAKLTYARAIKRAHLNNIMWMRKLELECACVCLFVCTCCSQCGTWILCKLMESIARRRGWARRYEGDRRRTSVNGRPLARNYINVVECERSDRLICIV